MGLIHEGVVARVVATEERNVNMSKRVTMEHCFKEEGKQEITKKREAPRWLLCTFKDRIKNYIKRKIYLKQQLLSGSFEIRQRTTRGNA